MTRPATVWGWDTQLPASPQALMLGTAQLGAFECIAWPLRCDGISAPVAQGEQTLIATAVARAGDQICSIDCYSSRPDPPAPKR